MITFLAISIIFIIAGCIIADKVEQQVSEKESIDSKKEKERVDTETLKILKDYGLINLEKYNENPNILNKA